LIVGRPHELSPMIVALAIVSVLLLLLEHSA
jgi:hypothetical protein